MDLHEALLFQKLELTRRWAPVMREGVDDEVN